MKSSKIERLQNEHQQKRLQVVILVLPVLVKTTTDNYIFSIVYTVKWFELFDAAILVFFFLFHFTSSGEGRTDYHPLLL
jgi:hypothetical protein